MNVADNLGNFFVDFLLKLWYNIYIREEIKEKSIKMNQNKILVLYGAGESVLAVVDGAEAAASFLMENCYVGCRSMIWSYEKQISIEIQNVFGVTGRKGISDEQLYNFCVDMLNDVYSGIYNWHFELIQVEYWTSK